jgi:hypothetical protein
MVYDFALFADTAPDLGSQSLTRLNTRRYVRQKRKGPPETAEHTLRPLSSPQGAQDVKQVSRLKDGTPRSILSLGPNIVHTAHRQAAMDVQQEARFPGLLESLLDFHHDGRRL